MAPNDIPSPSPRKTEIDTSRLVAISKPAKAKVNGSTKLIRGAPNEAGGDADAEAAPSGETDVERTRRQEARAASGLETEAEAEQRLKDHRKHPKHRCCTNPTDANGMCEVDAECLGEMRDGTMEQVPESILAANASVCDSTVFLLS